MTKLFNTHATVDSPDFSKTHLRFARCRREAESSRASEDYAAGP